MPNLKSIADLLSSAGLPTADLDSLDPTSFLTLEEDGQLTAVGAIEIHHPYGLLRSVAVKPEQRGKGLARTVVQQLEARAKANKLIKIFLLTTDASEYFRKHGFDLCDRSSAPPTIRSTSQFSKLCPSSSILMMKDISKAHHT